MSNTNVNSSTSALSSLNLDMLMRMLQEDATKTRSSPLSPVDTIGKGTKKAETAVSLTNEGVALPPPKSTKDLEGQSQLEQLAEDFAKFYTMMAKSAQLQTLGLSDEIEYVQESNKYSMAAAQTAISKQEKLLKEQTTAQDKEAKMQKTESALKIATWVVTGIVIGLTILSAAFTFGASLAAVPEEMELGAVAIGGEEAATEGASVAAEEGISAAAEEGAAEGTSAGMTSVEGLGVSADYGSSLADEAAMDAMDDVGDSTVQKIAQALKGKLLKMLMSFAVTGTQVASQSNEAAADFTTANYDTKIAGAERALGSATGEFKMTSSYNQFWQNQLGRSSESVTNISKTLSDIPATFGKILQTLRQATLTANQRV